MLVEIIFWFRGGLGLLEHLRLSSSCLVLLSRLVCHQLSFSGLTGKVGLLCCKSDCREGIKGAGEQGLG